MSYCDRHGNCLPPLIGSSIPLISYAISFLLFLLYSLDSIQPDSTKEKIQVATFALTNLAIKVLTYVLSLAFLGNKPLNMRLLKLELSKSFHQSF